MEGLILVPVLAGNVAAEPLPMWVREGSEAAERDPCCATAETGAPGRSAKLACGGDGRSIRSCLMKWRADRKLRFFFERRSIRVYSPGEVDEAVVQKLLAAAMSAPSAAAKNPWHFVVVRDRQILSRLAAALPHGQMLATAALGIVVCGDLEVAHDHQLSYLLQDCSAAIENLLLCAHILGLGACWLGVHPRAERIKSLREILSLPPSIIPVAGISLGYAGESKEPRAVYNPGCVHFETW
jgi:nitroreductase